MKILIKEKYNDLAELWRSFCELHTQLFEFTCEEYSYLLSSDIDSLENIVEKKDEIISKIKSLENIRKSIIDDLNNLLDEQTQISSVNDLLNLMNKFEKESGNYFLTKYNSLLIDIIEKIKIQNKRNQIFINKSLSSLKAIRDGLSGLKSFQTYNSHGFTGNSKSP